MKKTVFFMTFDKKKQEKLQHHLYNMFVMVIYIMLLNHLLHSQSRKIIKEKANRANPDPQLISIVKTCNV